MGNDTKNLITRVQAAARAGVSPRTIDNWRKEGLLTTYTRRGSTVARVLIDQDELDRVTSVQPVPVDA